MELFIWRFNASRGNFDGERILRDAEKAGLNLFRIQFPGRENQGEIQLWASQAYIERLRAANFSIGTETNGARKPEVMRNWAEGTGEAEDMAFKGRWFIQITYLKHPETSNCLLAAHPSKIHSILIKQEQLEKEFSVVGIQGGKELAK